MRVYTRYPNKIMYGVNGVTLDEALVEIKRIMNTPSLQIPNGLVEYGIEENGERICLTRKKFSKKVFFKRTTKKKEETETEAYWWR